MPYGRQKGKKKGTYNGCEIATLPGSTHGTTTIPKNLPGAVLNAIISLLPRDDGYNTIKFG